MTENQVLKTLKAVAREWGGEDWPIEPVSIDKSTEIWICESNVGSIAPKVTIRLNSVNGEVVDEIVTPGVEGLTATDYVKDDSHPLSRLCRWLKGTEGTSDEDKPGQ